MGESSRKIVDIKNIVESSLSGYLTKMSLEEFEGTQVYPDNIKDLVVIFLASSAGCDERDVIAACDGIRDGDDLRASYRQAAYEIRKDNYFAMGVAGVAEKLSIPYGNLNFN